VPVINALSDFEHPCQCLADLLTVREIKGELKGRTLAYLGDGNNVAHSLLLGCTKTGMRIRVATPPGWCTAPARSRRKPVERSRCSAIRPRRVRAPTCCTPTCGPAWGRKGKPMNGDWCSARTS